MDMTAAGECLDAHIPGAVNLRDLGGYPAANGRVRRRRLFRSGMTHQLEPEGLALLRARLGLRRVFDFRSDPELARDGHAAFADHGIEFRRVAVYGATAVTPEEQRDRYGQMVRGEYDWGARYRVLVTEHPAAFIDFVSALAEPDALPALFHCSAGRDRTGIAAALVLAVLGVAPETIAADYARTGALLVPHVHRYRHISDQMGFDAGQMATLLRTEAGHMRGFLAWLDAEHGGAERFLLAHGVSPATVTALRAALLEPA